RWVVYGCDVMSAFVKTCIVRSMMIVVLLTTFFFTRIRTMPSSIGAIIDIIFLLYCTGLTVKTHAVVQLRISTAQGLGFKQVTRSKKEKKKQQQNKRKKDRKKKRLLFCGGKTRQLLSCTCMSWMSVCRTDEFIPSPS